MIVKFFIENIGEEHETIYERVLKENSINKINLEKDKY